MKWLEKETTKGVLKYRMPNVAEGFYFLSLAENTDTAEGILVTKGKIIASLKDMVDFRSLGYETFIDMLDDKENNFKALDKIAGEILYDLNEVLAKKD
jgi:hypothetical protein